MTKNPTRLEIKYHKKEPDSAWPLTRNSRLPDFRWPETRSDADQNDPKSDPKPKKIPDSVQPKTRSDPNPNRDSTILWSYLPDLTRPNPNSTLPTRLPHLLGWIQRLGPAPNFPKNLKNIYNFIIIQNFCVCPLSLIFLFL
jgi:hypothetical protein